MPGMCSFADSVERRFFWFVQTRILSCRNTFGTREMCAHNVVASVTGVCVIGTFAREIQNHNQISETSCVMLVHFFFHAISTYNRTPKAEYKRKTGTRTCRPKGHPPFPLFKGHSTS